MNKKTNPATKTKRASAVKLGPGSKAEKTLPEKVLTLPRINVNERQLYDLEMLLNGAFAPLEGFLNEGDYTGVVEHMRLKGGELWPIPIVFDVPSSDNYQPGDEVALCDQYGNPLAVFSIESRYTPNKKNEAKKVYGTLDENHPGVKYLMREAGNVYLGGRVTSVALPEHHDYTDLRYTPAELKQWFKEKGWKNVAGFQTRNPMHRVHFELVKKAHEDHDIPVLIHPVVGLTREGDFDYVTRVRTYKIIHEKYAKDFTKLSLLPLAMRMAGPREALWHALIRKNYGCTHFIVGRDHAGPGKDTNGKPFYGPNDAHELAKQHEKELGVTIIASPEMVYHKKKDAYVPITDVKDKRDVVSISGTEFRKRLRGGEEIPEWYSFTECVAALRHGIQKQKATGLTIFFTGLSGAGKSTIANHLYAKLREIQDEAITLLDGDVIRENLSKGLGFSKEDRETNVLRVGYVASEITKHGGIAICSLIAPYGSSRKANRERISKVGTYIEVYVSTPVGVCEERDVKGLYKKARKGLLSHFTGVDDPYEVPTDPEVVIDTTMVDIHTSVEMILAYLLKHGFIEKSRYVG